MGELFGKQVYPEQCPVDAGTYKEGEVLKASLTAGRCQHTAAKGDTALAVVAETITTAREGAARAVPAGYRIPVYPLACQETVEVLSVASASYNPGDPIYLSDVAGMVTNAHSTSRPIGHFPRYGFAAIASTVAGQKIPCKLDVAVGADLVS